MKIYNCFFDGSCEPQNPNGNMGTGVYIISENQSFEDNKSYKAKIGNTNNIAEYLALIRVLKLMRKKSGDIINIKGDSKLVIMQMCGDWKIKEGAYVPYAREAKELLGELKLKNTVVLKWIPREQNEVADRLSKPKFI